MLLTLMEEEISTWKDIFKGEIDNLSKFVPNGIIINNVNLLETIVKKIERNSSNHDIEITETNIFK